MPKHGRVLYLTRSDHLALNAKNRTAVEKRTEITGTAYRLSSPVWSVGGTQRLKPKSRTGTRPHVVFHCVPVWYMHGMVCRPFGAGPAVDRRRPWYEGATLPAPCPATPTPDGLVVRRTA